MGSNTLAATNLHCRLVRPPLGSGTHPGWLAGHKPLVRKCQRMCMYQTLAFPRVWGKRMPNPSWLDPWARTRQTRPRLGGYARFPYCPDKKSAHLFCLSYPASVFYCSVGRRILSRRGSLYSALLSFERMWCFVLRCVALRCVALRTRPLCKSCPGSKQHNATCSLNLLPCFVILPGCCCVGPAFQSWQRRTPHAQPRVKRKSLKEKKKRHQYVILVCMGKKRNCRFLSHSKP